ncbi:MAG: DUF1849 family protein [Rhodospirillaceae bacterium]|nr:DUF1849 family protein [Rhodospirillaceae bacterium]
MKQSRPKPLEVSDVTDVLARFHALVAIGLAAIAGPSWVQAAPATLGDQSQAIAPGPGQDPVLMSHAAVYDVALIKASQTEGVRGASGRLTYTFLDRCDGYTIESELDASIAYSSGVTNHIVQRYAGWESTDGTRSTFSMRVYDNDELEDSYTGSVELDADGAGRAVYRGADVVTYDLPRGTVLSTSQIRGLIRAGRANAPLVAEPVMDGAFDQGPYRVTGYIAPLRQAAEESLEAQVSTGPTSNDGLLKGGYWPVSLAYFPLAGKAETPDYELSMHLQSNGIVRYMTQDFITYTLSFDLASVRALPGGC